MLTGLSSDRPIDDHRKFLHLLEVAETRDPREVELPGLHREGVAAGVETPDVGVVVVAAQRHGAVLQPRRDLGLAAADTRAGIAADRGLVLAEGHTTGHERLVGPVVTVGCCPRKWVFVILFVILLFCLINKTRRHFYYFV